MWVHHNQLQRKVRRHKGVRQRSEAKQNQPELQARRRAPKRHPIRPAFVSPNKGHHLGLDDDQLFTAIGRTVQPEGYVPDDDIIKASPMAGMGRGGALMN